MTRRCLTLVVLMLLSGALTPARGDDDEPTYRGKKLSHWLKLLSDGKTPVERVQGVLGVEGVGFYASRKVVPALSKALAEDKEPVVRARAARATGRACAKALSQAREDKKDELPRFDNARDALATALRTDKADAVREAAAAALGEMGSDARGAAGALALALKDTHAGTVAAAAAALRRMGRDARDAETELLALLGNAKVDIQARTDAATALGQIKADVSAAMKTMREVVEDKKVEIPKDTPEKDKADALKKAQEEKTLLRRAAIDALGKWGKEAADSSATLAVVLIDKDSTDDLRRSALASLEQFGADAKAAVPALVKAIGDSDRVVRCLAMQAIGKLQEVLEDNRRPAIKAMLKATEDSNTEVALTAVESLGVLSATGLGEEKAEVLKRLEEVNKREGRKLIREAAVAARKKIEGKKKE